MICFCVEGKGGGERGIGNKIWKTHNPPNQFNSFPPFPPTKHTKPKPKQTKTGKAAFFAVGFLGGGAAGLGVLLTPASSLPENLVQVCHVINE